MISTDVPSFYVHAFYMMMIDVLFRVRVKKGTEGELAFQANQG
jgi:hypothetical protein